MKSLEDKVDVILEKVGEIETRVAVQGVILDEHQRRSIAAEENIALLREEFKPVQKHVNMIEGGLKIVGLTSAILTIVSLVAKLLGLL